MNALRNVLVGALGLLVGGLGSSLFTSCACPEAELTPVPAGTYTANVEGQLEPDYKLEVSADFKTAVETYTRDGKAYEIHYTITRDEI